MEHTESITQLHVSEDAYQKFLGALLSGKRFICAEVAEDLMNQRIPVKHIYVDLFQRALYRIGELWEYNQISVAAEHMATSVTEGIMNQIYPKIISLERADKKVIIASVENELHQIGGKMAADVFEMHGWDAIFLGADIPASELIRFIHEVTPDCIGLSLSVYFHLNELENMIKGIRTSCPGLDVLIGGQAFRHGGAELEKSYPGVRHVATLDALEEFIRHHGQGGRS